MNNNDRFTQRAKDAIGKNKSDLAQETQRCAELKEALSRIRHFISTL